MTNSVNTNIAYGNITYPLFDAAIAAGATLEELEKLERGEYSKKFTVRLLAWHELKKTIDLHVEDARAKAAEKRMKRGRRRGA